MDMKAALAELIGTFTLVFVGTATAVFAGSGILGPGGGMGDWSKSVWVVSSQHLTTRCH